MAGLRLSMLSAPDSMLAFKARPKNNFEFSDPVTLLTEFTMSSQHRSQNDGSICRTKSHVVHVLMDVDFNASIGQLFFQ